MSILLKKRTVHIILLIVLLLSGNAMAEAFKDYELAHMTFPVPGNWITLSRGEDPKSKGLDARAYDIFVQNPTLQLISVAPGGKPIVLINMEDYIPTSNTVFAYEVYSDAVLLDLFNADESAEDVSVESFPSGKYIRFPQNLTANAFGEYSITYVTAISLQSGKFITAAFKITSSQSITQQEDNMLQQLVSGVRFTNRKVNTIEDYQNGAIVSYVRVAALFFIFGLVFFIKRKTGVHWILAFLLFYAVDRSIYPMFTLLSVQWPKDYVGLPVMILLQALNFYFWLISTAKRYSIKRIWRVFTCLFIGAGLINAIMAALFSLEGTWSLTRTGIWASGYIAFTLWNILLYRRTKKTVTVTIEEPKL